MPNSKKKSTYTKGQEGRLKGAMSALLEAGAKLPPGFGADDLFPLLQAQDPEWTLNKVKGGLTRAGASGHLVRVSIGKYALSSSPPDPNSPLDDDEQILNRALAAVMELTKLFHRQKERDRKLRAMFDALSPQRK